MPKVATIPTTLDPDAAAFLAEIGQERELEVLLDHARATIPNLIGLHVVLHDFPETGPPSLTIEAYRDPAPEGRDEAGREFSRWMGATFPPRVLQNFTLMAMYHPDER